MLIKWLTEMIGQLGTDLSFYERWQDAVAYWEFSTVKPRLREKIEDLRPWEYHEEHDAVADTLRDIYYGKFIMGKIGNSLNISIDDWLKKPRFECDRDVAAITRCNRLRTDSLESLGDVLENE